MAALKEAGLVAEDDRARGLWRGPFPGDVLLLLLFLLRSVVEEEEEERVMTRPGEGGNSLCSGIMGCSIQSVFKPAVVGDVILGTDAVEIKSEVSVSALLVVVSCSSGITAEDEVVLGGVGSMCTAAA